MSVCLLVLRKEVTGLREELNSVKSELKEVREENGRLKSHFEQERSERLRVVPVCRNSCGCSGLVFCTVHCNVSMSVFPELQLCVSDVDDQQVQPCSGHKATTSFLAVQLCLCLCGLILSLLLGSILLNVLQFLCFHIQFSYSCLNDSIPLIYDIVLFLFRSLMTVSAHCNLCLPTACLPASILPTNSCLHSSYISTVACIHPTYQQVPIFILATCPSHVNLLFLTLVSTLSIYIGHGS